MRHPTLILLLFVLAALSVGILFGWRARISTEYDRPPRRYLPAVPDDLAVRDPYPDVVLGWIETGGRV